MYYIISFDHKYLMSSVPAHSDVLCDSLVVPLNACLRRSLLITKCLLNILSSRWINTAPFTQLMSTPSVFCFKYELFRVDQYYCQRDFVYLATMVTVFFLSGSEYYSFEFSTVVLHGNRFHFRQAFLCDFYYLS